MFQNNNFYKNERLYNRGKSSVVTYFKHLSFFSSVASEEKT